MKELSDLFQSARVERLRSGGVLFFDVDDTLLARRGGSTATGETYAESEAAKLIPRLLSKAVRVCLMTGHGLRQLETRFLQPLINDLAVIGNDCERALFVYANAGATRVEFRAESWKLDDEYTRQFFLSAADRDELASITEGMLASTGSDRSRYEIEVREGCILALRPRTPAANNLDRQQQIEFARRQIADKGMQSRFRVTAAGRTTIELSRTGFSKATACSDLFERLTVAFGSDDKQMENASLYIGDEFGPGGNDREIIERFPELACISVGAGDVDEVSGSLYSATTETVLSGPPATAKIIARILKTLD